MQDVLYKHCMYLVQNDISGSLHNPQNEEHVSTKKRLFLNTEKQLNIRQIHPVLHNV